MSAFILYIDHTDQPIDPPVVQRMFNQLDDFGVDGRELFVQQHFAIGHQHFWTVPQEQGERQPLYHADSDSWLAFHGRIDNRAALFAEIGIDESDSLSDAQVLLRYLLEFGDTRLANIIGPFVFVHFKPGTGQLLAARDAMGGRYMVFHQSERFTLFSTHEIAIAAHPQVGLKLNDEKRIRFLSHLLENQPSSLLDGSKPLHPGQKLTLRSGQLSLSTYYLPPPKSRLSLAGDQAYAAEFRRLLIQAVERRMRSVSAVGCMLSGGLDSVPIAIAGALLSRKLDHGLSAFSWVFDEHPEDDERKYSTGVCEQFGIVQHCINCDHVWPQFDASTYINPAIPYAWPFSSFNQQLLAKAETQGVGTLLSGLGGDVLYTDTSGLLLHLLVCGRFADALQEIKYLRSQSIGLFDLVKYHLIAPMPIVRNWLASRRTRESQSAEYLTEQAQALLRSPRHWLSAQLKSARRPQQYLNVVDSFEGEDCHYGKHMEVMFGVERRYPLRDRDLAEFMLSVPVDQLRLGPEMRPIVKRAFAEELGEDLLQRNSKTKFRSVIAAGLSADKQQHLWLNIASAVWRTDVQESYFSTDPDSDLAACALKWACAYHEYWQSVCYNPLIIELGLNDEVPKNEI